MVAVKHLAGHLALALESRTALLRASNPLMHTLHGFFPVPLSSSFGNIGELKSSSNHEVAPFCGLMSRCVISGKLKVHHFLSQVGRYSLNEAVAVEVK